MEKLAKVEAQLFLIGESISTRPRMVPSCIDNAVKCPDGGKAIPCGSVKGQPLTNPSVLVDSSRSVACGQSSGCQVESIKISGQLTEDKTNIPTSSRLRAAGSRKARTFISHEASELGLFVAHVSCNTKTYRVHLELSDEDKGGSDLQNDETETIISVVSSNWLKRWNLLCAVRLQLSWLSSTGWKANLRCFNVSFWCSRTTMSILVDTPLFM